MVHVLKGTWFYRLFIELVLYVHILATRGRAMSLMTPVLSKYLSSPTPKLGGGPLIFERQVVEPPVSYNMQKIPGGYVPPFCCIKVRKCPHFFTKFDFFGVRGKNCKIPIRESF